MYFYPSGRTSLCSAVLLFLVKDGGGGRVWQQGAFGGRGGGMDAERREWGRSSRICCSVGGKQSFSEPSAVCTMTAGEGKTGDQFCSMIHFLLGRLLLRSVKGLAAKAVFIFVENDQFLRFVSSCRSADFFPPSEIRWRFPSCSVCYVIHSASTVMENWSFTFPGVWIQFSFLSFY